MYIISEEDRKWFMEAVQAQSVDVVKRMKEITLVMQTPEQVLEAQGVTSADIEGIISQKPSFFLFFYFYFLCFSHVLIWVWVLVFVNW